MPFSFSRSMHNTNISSPTLSPRSQIIVNCFDSSFDTREALRETAEQACLHIGHLTDLQGRASDVGNPNFNLSAELNEAFCSLEITGHIPPNSELALTPATVGLLESNQPFFNALEPALEDLCIKFEKIGNDLVELNLANVATGLPTPVRELDELQALHETITAIDDFSTKVQELVSQHNPQNVDTFDALTTLSDIASAITNVLA